MAWYIVLFILSLIITLRVYQDYKYFRKERLSTNAYALYAFRDKVVFALIEHSDDHDLKRLYESVNTMTQYAYLLDYTHIIIQFNEYFDNLYRGKPNVAQKKYSKVVSELRDEFIDTLIITIKANCFVSRILLSKFGYHLMHLSYKLSRKKPTVKEPSPTCKVLSSEIKLSKNYYEYQKLAHG